MSEPDSPSGSKSPVAWPIRARRELVKTAIFRLEQRDSVSPRTGAVFPFNVMEAPNWVNVIPITDDGDVILVEQYRHGVGELTLEIPGGVIDAEDESPERAAHRELLEETGYRADEVELIGQVTTNPAIFDNVCFTCVARGLKRQADQKLDLAEDIRVVKLPLEQVYQRIEQGAITHALVIAAFYWFQKRGGA